MTKKKTAHHLTIAFEEYRNGTANLIAGHNYTRTHDKPLRTYSVSKTTNLELDAQQPRKQESFSKRIEAVSQFLKQVKEGEDVFISTNDPYLIQKMNAVKAGLEKTLSIKFGKFVLANIHDNDVERQEVLDKIRKLIARRRNSIKKNHSESNGYINKTL